VEQAVSQKERGDDSSSHNPMAFGVPWLLQCFLHGSDCCRCGTNNGQLAEQCDDAFQAQRWADVVDTCKNLAVNSATS